MEDKTYKVIGDIEVQPGGQLIVKNAVLKFPKAGGIKGKDCTFKAENSLFKAQRGKWKNITLVGNVEGYIKGCIFEKGLGRKGEEINQLSGEDNFWSKETYGGAIFLDITGKKFLIKDCYFSDCSAKQGGAVYVRKNAIISNGFFRFCEALNGGGVFANKNADIVESLFSYCHVQRNGGGIRAKSNVSVRNCNLEFCSADKGGGVHVGDNTTVENCTFTECSATTDGGGIYCQGEFNQIKSNKFKDCDPDNVGGTC